MSLPVPPPVEIERKFLVSGEGWRTVPGAEACRVVQGYLCADPERTVRVRRMGDEGFLTAKGPTEGFTRTEVEFPIGLAEVEVLLGMCLPGVIDKTRHRVEHAGFIWEVDEFHGLNAGLVVAEIELPAEDTVFELPEWIGQEVTGDFRYANSQLAVRPFGGWEETLEAGGMVRQQRERHDSYGPH